MYASYKHTHARRSGRQRNNQTNERTNVKKDRSDCETTTEQQHSGMFLFSSLLRKWHNLQLFSDGNFSFCDFAFYCVIHIYTCTHTIQSHVFVHLVDGSQYMLRIGGVSIFNYATVWGRNWKLLLSFFVSLPIPLLLSVYFLFYENVAMHVFISV